MKRKSNPLHSAKSPEHYTPRAYVHAACETMGGIDCDPASCEKANEIVRAETFYSKEKDGLLHPWPGKVFLNPPGGLVYEFWCKLLRSFQVGVTTEAIWIGYSLEQLQTLQRCRRGSPARFPLCFPKKRIHFWGGESDSPTHANYVCYLPKLEAVGERTRRFVYYFKKFGEIKL